MKNLILLISILILSSCSSPKLESKFLLNKEINNKESNAIVPKSGNIPKSDRNENFFRLDNSIEVTEIESELKNFNTVLDTTKANTIKYERINIIAEVTKLFDPTNSTCNLPKKVERKLKALKKKGQNWAPEYVVGFLDDFPEYASHLSGQSITTLMHTIKIKSNDGSIREWILFESPTYENFDLNNYTAKSGFNSFMYSLDCSGYLNAAIEASATIPGADIKTSAKSALDNQNSLFIGGGVLISPIASAFYGNSFGVTIDVELRKLILDAIINIPNVKQDDLIIVSNSYEAIWSSNKGSSSFNGKASIGGGAGAGIGVMNISASSSAGGNFSRESSFSGFDTYFTSRVKIPNLKPFSIKEVKQERANLEQ